MSSRFVSGGTIGSSGEAANQSESIQQKAREPAKNSEWEAVQQELEAERKRREEHRAKAASGEQKSLYDILQENKAAKQAAFEEQTSLRNQFRALDEDEADFLEEIRERRRKEDAEVRRETEEGLKAFRERQQKTDGTTSETGPDQESEETWGAGRKRKRVKDREVKGVRRRVSEAEESPAAEKKKAPEKEEEEGKKKKKDAPAVVSVPARAKKPMALVSYGSDDSDDD
ncbi:N-terminal domain of NEFA-interacting nuclear protein NIP30-domain-containing protein [Stachybotrys elegans]|uniref:N-terminal domain of NEFA-interacting nuclear protein NIP30-domain-containing protein n=1 Tax=Stachybotrys elegans TaxID=80388 RepID=A0A8K0T176_9HYPO|nr:N-terminal domain of NEFA-interacting nuclear protein NIP30-domain-containing protein [Stachybotrys elegans]